MYQKLTWPLLILSLSYSVAAREFFAADWRGFTIGQILPESVNPKHLIDLNRYVYFPDTGKLIRFTVTRPLTNQVFTADENFDFSTAARREVDFKSFSERWNQQTASLQTKLATAHAERGDVSILEQKIYLSNALLESTVGKKAEFAIILKNGPGLREWKIKPDFIKNFDPEALNLFLEVVQSFQEVFGEVPPAVVADVKKLNGGGLPAKPPAPFTPVLINGMAFVYIPPGKFMMGSPDLEFPKSAFETLPFPVTITRGFYMKTTLVTQAEWMEISHSKTNPSQYKGANHPIENVSWWSALVYCNFRSVKDGLPAAYELTRAIPIRGTWADGDLKVLAPGEIRPDLDNHGYRLPTEAEWEYAARAGTQTAFFFGDTGLKINQYAWYAGNSDHTTHPIGGLRPNPWGLYDMVGNVAQLVEDTFGDLKVAPVTDPRYHETGEFVVTRGGGYDSTERVLRSANRGRVGLDVPYAGFRLVISE
jgi:formylglycine-generating enzyme required for sulfatase activity